MYTLNFDPVIFELFGFQVRWYSLTYIIGFMFLWYFMNKAVKRELIKGLDHDAVENFIVYIVVGVVLGSRIGYFLFYDLSRLFSLEVFQVWHGGMSFHGGLVGLVFAVWLFVRMYKVSLWALLDVCVVPGALGLALGRLGNLVNGELAGTVFSGRFCVVFSLYDDVCRHAYPVYALISHLILFVVLLVVFVSSYKSVGSGKLSAYFLMGYGVLRVITDVFKVDSVFCGLKTGQWLSLVMIVVGVWLLYRNSKKKV